VDIAIQLYTVRDRTATDMTGTIAALAEMGYRFIETAGYGNASPEEIRTALDEAGMRAISAHVGVDRLIDERPAVIEEMQTLGCEHVVVPWLSPERRTPEFTTELVTYLNEWAPELEEAGLRLGYHNHEFEFAPLNGKTMFDLIRDGTAPSNVSLQIDLGWAQFAGADPVQLVRENAGRVPLLHGKDMSAEGGSATTGEGTLPWKKIIKAAQDAGTEYLIVENDQPDDSLADAEKALENLQRLLG
jgi:sugar phosphate isomerase/epimerase